MANNRPYASTFENNGPHVFKIRYLLIHCASFGVCKFIGFKRIFTL